MPTRRFVVNGRVVRAVLCLVHCLRDGKKRNQARGPALFNVV